MRIAYLDFRFPEGHKEQNSYFINILASMGIEITVFCPRGWYKDFAIDERVEIIEIPFDVKANRYKGVRNVLELVKREKYILRNTRKQKFEAFFIASFEGVSYFVFDLMTKNKDKYLLYHDNIDALENKVRCFLFQNYSSSNRHIVFQNYMRKRLLELSKKDINVYVLHHELNQKESNGGSIADSPEIIALSNTNSEDQISEIIKLDQKDYFNNDSYRMLVKSKTNTYQGERVIVVTGYLSKTDYDNLFCNCEIVLLPFDDSVKYRESGTIIDALSNGKCVISSNTLIGNAYRDQYPDKVFIYNSLDELPQLIKTASKHVGKSEQFLIDHSKTSVLNDMRGIISDV